MSRILIFANGYIPNLDAARALFQVDDFIIAADGGANHLQKMDILPNLIVGDLDSVDEAVLHAYKSVGVEVWQHPVDKDETDLELALQRALETGAESIVIVGALGGRLDQTIANLSLLTDERLLAQDVRIDDGVESAFFCRRQVEVCGRSGDVISLIPWGGPVTGILTGGLQWPLYQETLYPEKSRGISNVMTSESVSLKIKSGLLLIIHTRKS